jgi:hypothetical protein
VKQEGQYGCLVLGTDWYGSRPMELFLFLFDGGRQSTNGRHVNVRCTHKVTVCRL